MNSLKPLLYFSIFNYPLSEKEIYLFSTAKNEDDIKSELSYLKNKGAIVSDEHFYALKDLEQSVSRRKAGNKMAHEVMERAIKRGVFISKFPYIKAVGISGSLSKNYHDKDSDVDFFIITENNRLWVARTLLMLYKKIFLFNSRKLFCINYYITTSTLEIQEKNIFTATELVTLIPVIGDFEQFYAHNTWAAEFLPNADLNRKPKYTTIQKPVLAVLFEKILNTSIGTSLDKLFLKMTLKKWSLKFKGLSKRDFKIALKSTEGVSKHHPRNFQKTVIDRLNEKYAEFQSKHNIILEEEHA